MSRPQRRADAARKVADWLDQQGEHFKANTVREVCRSLDAARRSLVLLHKDNMELRSK